ncbi:bifunctional phosphopantothenoylcysteine decarboxylase/phosphopantothenate--cysteine ligase CoaBC [Fimbriimonas ginsengisoli]|uniref:Coenzyme A biosynthesis bifunctional protein CoaBC n=1 Tax=Fimbriimonas ginsengisoli Gsoil 348 TaxID=661478 RepID=A0A068NR72_FIMGI|nr:bifunctional phosphopantothenoylcysteine decarboxylase/phosphopantothenate--cysteine ligase CoaBC [Fimbriimonas ginsengisoli]AIE85265.1 phosphopantothenoylcysteine synthetase/decarboxylase [Fimbriimonas ginsengisoli Gsoil 348]
MNIVLGVSGSVAAYRAADLARELMRAGHSVRVCLTDSAQKFVTAALFEALTGQACLQDTFEEPDRGRMAHIDWARQADIVVVAPATANTIAKIAHGIGDDMLTTLVLATTAPLVVAPAMNPQMYASEATREAMTKLRERATWVVEPTDGDVACGEHGQGKLAAISQIVEAVQTVARRSKQLEGRKVLITSGPTQEPIDDVRFVSNRSSGKMGAALARAALLMGAEVTVVSGPARAALPLQANIVHVRTAQEMLEAGLAHCADANLIIGAAAVADYRPAVRHRGKIRRSAEPTTLELHPNPDIIAEIAKAAPDAITVGFAAEPSRSLDAARDKLARKGLYAIAANDVSRDGIGFDADQNSLRLITLDSPVVFDSGLMSKLGCALWLLDRVAK